MEPHPSNFSVGTAQEIAFFFIAGAAVVIFLPWAIKAGASRNWVPSVIGSGLVCPACSRPMLDLLGHLHWANNLIPAFTNFGITVPALIPLCYVAFLGLEAYFAYFVIRKNHRRPLMLLGMGIITDAVMETSVSISALYRILRCPAVRIPQVSRTGGASSTAARLSPSALFWLRRAAPSGFPTNC